MQREPPPTAAAMSATIAATEELLRDQACTACARLGPPDVGAVLVSGAGDGGCADWLAWYADGGGWDAGLATCCVTFPALGGGDRCDGWGAVDGGPLMYPLFSTYRRPARRLPHGCCTRACMSNIRSSITASTLPVSFAENRLPDAFFQCSANCSSRDSSNIAAS